MRIIFDFKNTVMSLKDDADRIVDIPYRWNGAAAFFDAVLGGTTRVELMKVNDADIAVVVLATGRGCRVEDIADGIGYAITIDGNIYGVGKGGVK